MAQAPEKVRVAPRAVGLYLAQIAIVFAVQFAAGKLGDALQIINSGGIGPVWPASGVALGSLLLFGYQVWPGVAAGAFLLGLLSSIPPLAAVVYGIGTTLAALTGAFLLRRIAKFHPSLSRLRDALALIVFGGLGSAMVSASIGVSLLYAAHVRGWSGFGRAWVIYWFGDSMGVLLVTPLVLAAPNVLRIRPRARIAEFTALLLFLTVVCFVVFGDLPLIPVRLHVLAFAVLPFVMWAAIRFGMIGATLSTLFVATIATVETAVGSGPFAQNTPFTNAVLLDVFFAVLSVSGMTLAAVIAERKQAEKEREHLVREQAAVEARLRLATIVESSDDAIIGEDRGGIITDWNKGAEQLYGYSAGEVIGKPISLLRSPDRSGDFAGIMGKHDTANRYETVHQRKDGTRIEVSLTISLIEDVEGGIVGSSVIVRDITQRKRQEAVLCESEERFRLMADTAPVLIWMADTDMLCTYFNKPWLDFTGRSIDSEVGNGWAEGVHPEDLEKCLDTYAQAFDRRAEFRMEYRLRRHDGEYRWVLDIGVPRFNQDRSFVGYIGIGVDVTDRKLAERELGLATERLSLAMQAGRAGGWEWDTESGRSFRFGGTHALLGTTPEAYSGTVEEFWDRVHPEDRAEVHDAVENAKQNNTEFNEEFRVVWPDGTVHWLRSQGKFYYAANGEPERMLGISVNITERKRAEEALRRSEERFRLAAQAGKMFAYEWDAATDVIVRSAESAQILGIDDATLTTGKQILANVHPDDRERLKTAVDELSPERPYLQISYRIVRPDGKVIWVQRSSRAHFDERGRMLRVIGMVADITERKQAEEALEKSEEKFSKAFRESPMALALTSAKDHRYIDVNETFERITGWRRDELIGRTPFDIGIWVDPAERVELTKRLLTEGSLRNLELRFRMRDGSVRVGLASAELIELDGRPCVLAVTADITEYKRGQEALRESEDKLRLLLDSTAEAIYGIDLEHRCTFCNPACLRALGYERIDEVLGKNMHELMHHTRPDGTLFPVEECRVHQVIRTGEGVHADEEVLWRANGTSFPAEYWSYPQRRGRELVGAVVAFTDVTQRKLAEAALANVSGRLIEAQEKERTRIARDLHDDIGQRLALLTIELERLQENSPDLPVEVRSRMGELQKQTSEIATDVQTLSHELHSAKLEYLGLAAAMRGFCKEFGEQQKVEIDFTTHDLPIPLSPDISLCLFRVLQEALHNSVKHSGVRHFEVRLWGTTDEIHLTVMDSGAGFDSEAVKESRGLGLISMEERLKLVKGTFSIDSQPKRGTTIHARVPLSSGSDSMRAAG